MPEPDPAPHRVWPARFRLLMRRRQVQEAADTDDYRPVLTQAGAHMRKLSCLLYLCAALGWRVAVAEPLVSVNNLNPLTSDVKYNVQITPLDVNGNRIDALVTQVTWTFQQQLIQASIPAFSAPYVFTGLQIWYRVESGTGIVPVQWGAFQHKQAPKNVATGIPVNCVYTAPTLTVGDLTCTPAPPAPPPPPAISPDGTRIDATTGTAFITDATGAIWRTMPVDPTADPVAGQTGISRNGVRVSRAVNYAIWKSGKVCQQDIVSSSTRSLTCECWNGGWASSALAAC